MAKKTRKRRQPDPAEYAFGIMQHVIEATGDMPAEPAQQPTQDQAGKDPAAVALGRKGGLKGGPARAAKLTAEERSQMASRAALARWSKHKARGDDA
jgi:hypothetical protein